MISRDSYIIQWCIPATYRRPDLDSWLRTPAGRSPRFSTPVHLSILDSTHNSRLEAGLQHIDATALPADGRTRKNRTRRDTDILDCPAQRPQLAPLLNQRSGGSSTFNSRVLSALWLAAQHTWHVLAAPHSFPGYCSTLLQIIPAHLFGYLIIPSRSIPIVPPRQPSCPHQIREVRTTRNLSYHGSDEV